MKSEPNAAACRLCGSPTRTLFHATLLKKYSTGYHQCGQCGFLQTDEPHWLDEAYKNPINLTDTGILARNIQLASITTAVLGCFFDPSASFVDYAGGYGVFTRLMRDIGFEYFWHDPSTQNLLTKGFEYKSGGKPVELVSTFESFEHFVQPLEDIEKMLAISRNIFFSTELVPKPVPAPEHWWYYCLEHGQHVSFYSMNSLKTLARKLGLNFYSDGKSLHLFTEKQIPPVIFRLVLKFARRGLANFLGRRMTSKTFSDMKHLISRQERA